MVINVCWVQEYRCRDVVYVWTVVADAVDRSTHFNTPAYDIPVN